MCGFTEQQQQQKKNKHDFMTRKSDWDLMMKMFFLYGDNDHKKNK